jgi:hypothetical protein
VYCKLNRLKDALLAAQNSSQATLTFESEQSNVTEDAVC